MRQISYVTGYIFKVIGKYTHVHMKITIGGVAKIPHKQIIIKKTTTRRCTQKKHNIHVIHNKPITNEKKQ